MTDTTASILEAIVSDSKSEFTSTTPNSSLFNGTQKPIHPMIRCSKVVYPEGPSKPGSYVRFRIPNAHETGIHILESVWIEFSKAPGTTTPSGLDLAALKAIDSIELRTAEHTLIETMRAQDIYIHSRINLSSAMYSLFNNISSTSSGTENLQVPIPLCILKDTGWFPYLSLKQGLEIGLRHSMTNLPTITRSSVRLWITGYAIPTTSFPLYENKSYVFPITTFRSQVRVFEKGSAVTEETFLLEDPRDLQELSFVFRPDPTDIDVPFGVLGPGNEVFESLRDSWIEVGTDKITDPLRSQITRSIAFLQRHSRVPEEVEGIHTIPISNVSQPSLYGFGTPGLMSHIQPKISLKMRFNSVSRPPGDRVRYRVYALMTRGQRLRIQSGKVRVLDESYGKPTKTERVKDPVSEINVDDPGSLAINDSIRPKSSIGYLPRYSEITHEPFSKITRTHALRGSHKFGDLIVSRVPLETDYMGNMILRTRLPMLPDSYRWVNGVGFSLIKRVIVRHEDIILHDSPGDALFMLRQQDMDLDPRSRRDAIEFGYRSTSVDGVSLESYRELGSPDGFLRIPIPWSFSQDEFHPLPTAALRDRSLEVEIRIANVEDVVVTLSGDSLGVTQREELGGIHLSETLLDITGYVLPTRERRKVIAEPKVIRCLRYKIQSFSNPEGILRVIPIRSGLKRLLIVSPSTSGSSPGEMTYNPIRLVQIYSGSTKWYQQEQPAEFFEEWSRWRQGSGEPEVPILCVDNRPGFINAARLDELRIETTPGRLMVLSETEEFYQIRRAKIGPLYAD